MKKAGILCSISIDAVCQGKYLLSDLALFFDYAYHFCFLIMSHDIIVHKPMIMLTECTLTLPSLYI